ncbi:hypothetical protein [Nonomuraea sp. NPDC046570]|uniref:hypothetical protein n=1 Tax=Nonomuraea sp. NPDC046570 TaxID=3155255 RepID=UPI0033C55348
MDLLARACVLKPGLVHYATSGRFAGELTAVLARFFADGPATDEAGAALPVDYFTLQHRLPGGDTVVDRFVAEHPQLDETDRELLLGWKDVVEGVFEVVAREGAAVRLFNLVDELTYRVFSDLGDDAFEPLAAGMYLVGRLVPLGRDAWLISGTPAVHTAESRAALVPVAAHIALENPAYVFRNPDALARAWRMTADQRRCFIAHFGTDLVVMPGDDVARRLRAYLTHQAHRLGGQPPGEIELPAHVTRARTVALIFDEADGLGYYADFGLLQEAFADPRLLVRRQYRDVVTAYLRGEAVSPVPIARLAARDPAKASAVFARLLNKPGFDWERSGQALLRTHKPGYYDGPRLPTASPMTAAIAEHLGPPAA